MDILMAIMFGVVIFGLLYIKMISDAVDDYVEQWDNSWNKGDKK